MKVTYAVARVAVALLDDPTVQRWGYELSRSTGLPSGVLHPVLHRLLEAGLVRDGWEDEATHGRPRRRYYVVTAEGARALPLVLERARARRLV